MRREFFCSLTAAHCMHKFYKMALQGRQPFTAALSLVCLDHFFTFCFCCTDPHCKWGTMDGQFVTLAVCILLFIGLLKTSTGEPLSHGSIVFVISYWLCASLYFSTQRNQRSRAIWRRKRGCRAGEKRWAMKRRYKPCLLSAIMGNIRSLVRTTSADPAAEGV